MKLILLSFIPLTLALLPSCTKSQAEAGKAENPPENGAQYRKGEGVTLTEEMARSINLQTVAVADEKVAAHIQLSLRVLPNGKAASGTISPDKSALLKEGVKVEVKSAPPQQARVESVSLPSAQTFGESEVTVTLSAELAGGTEVSAVAVMEEAEEAAVIPKSALLATAEGNFVYAKNGKFFVRTPVKTGAADQSRIVVTDGLYSGDEVVSSAVMSLWLAELQVLRGGKACTCGH